jgi:hypothetical protein
MLVEVGAVKKTQTVFVAGKMGGHPVQNHPDPMLMQAIDEKHEVLGRAVTAGRGKVTKRQVSPGSVKGMFRDRQKLHMGETHVLYIFRQPRAELPVR